MEFSQKPMVWCGSHRRKSTRKQEFSVATTYYQISEGRAFPAITEVLARHEGVLNCVIHANTNFWLQQRDKPRLKVYRPTVSNRSANHAISIQFHIPNSPRLDICRCRWISARSGYRGVGSTFFFHPHFPAVKRRREFAPASLTVLEGVSQDLLSDQYVET